MSIVTLICNFDLFFLVFRDRDFSGFRQLHTWFDKRFSWALQNPTLVRPHSHEFRLNNSVTVDAFIDLQDLLRSISSFSWCHSFQSKVRIVLSSPSSFNDINKSKQVSIKLVAPHHGNCEFMWSHWTNNIDYYYSRLAKPSGYSNISSPYLFFISDALKWLKFRK